MEHNKFWEQNQAETMRDALSIILIAHVHEPRGHKNKEQLQCSGTERFSIEEFNEIYQGIVGAGYFVQAIYFNEIEFINDYTEHPNRFINCLVYSLARNGIGANKKTIIPSFCELVGLRYTTSPSLSCALARNKYYFSVLLNTHNIPVPKSWLYSENGTWINSCPPIGTKVICKPCFESASQGINESKIITYSDKHCYELLQTSHIVQEYIGGAECEVPIIKNGNDIHVFPPVGIDLHGKRILDEETSEHYHYDFYTLDKVFSSKTVDKIKNYAERAFQLLQMEVYGRIDFRINRNEEPFIIDISTTPYTTKHSSFAFAFELLGFEYFDVYRAIISAAMMRQQKLN